MDNFYYLRQHRNESNFCFVLMPFNEQHKVLFDGVIKPSLGKLKIQCMKGDDIKTPGVILGQIWKYIQKAEFVIADISGQNPNVFYELALCDAIWKRVLIITQTIDEIPFDLRHLRVIEYKIDTNGFQKLGTDINYAIKEMREIKRNSEATIISYQEYDLLIDLKNRIDELKRYEDFASEIKFRFGLNREDDLSKVLDRCHQIQDIYMPYPKGTIHI